MRSIPNSGLSGTLLAWSVTRHRYLGCTEEVYRHTRLPRGANWRYQVVIYQVVREFRDLGVHDPVEVRQQECAFFGSDLRENKFWRIRRFQDSLVTNHHRVSPWLMDDERKRREIGSRTSSTDKCPPCGVFAGVTHSAAPGAGSKSPRPAREEKISHSSTTIPGKPSLTSSKMSRYAMYHAKKGLAS